MISHRQAAHVPYVRASVKCVEQVVYFHNPKFARQPQLSLEDIPQSAINTLPLLTELFPDIKVFYDDDPFIPILMCQGVDAVGEAPCPEYIEVHTSCPFA